MFIFADSFTHFDCRWLNQDARRWQDIFPELLVSEERWRASWGVQCSRGVWEPWWRRERYWRRGREKERYWRRWWRRKGGRRRRERTPSPVQAEEEEEEKEEAEQEEDNDDDEEGVRRKGAAGGTRVWLRGPSTLPPRPIPLERRPIIRPARPR